ncbi:MAG: prepilin peptidase [Clostridia bacterium]|nr:prepilin peptidase [Clostridia bacterium]
MEEYYKIVALILAGLLGVCVGSFLNVVIYRVPLGMSLAKPDSHCPQCKYQLKWSDNIPVLSYIFLGGKCRNCKQHIPFRYTAVELANMLAWLASVWLFWDDSKVFAVLTALATSLLICVFFIDLEHMLVFDRFVIMLAVLGVVSMFFDPYYGWLSHLIGGAVGFVFLYGIHALFYYGFKKDALGGGDIKLTGAVGLLLGWERLLLAIVIASLSACVILLIASRRASSAQGEETSTPTEEESGENEVSAKEYPFAPFLCTGFWVAMMFGASIITAYLSLFGL